MKPIFFENRNETEDISVRRSIAHLYSAHFHLALEILVVRKGEYACTLNGNSIVVKEGCVAVFDSYDVHSFDERKEEGADDCLIIVPFRYLQGFNAWRGDKKIVNAVISNEALCDRIIQIADVYLRGDDSEQVKESAIGLILSLLQQKLQCSEDKSNDEKTLARRILSYVLENFKDDASLGAVAKALGYTPAHVSRVFHRYMRCSLPKYVNDLRLDYIRRLRESGDQRTTVELIYEAGFNSQQTYYRCKNQKQTEVRFGFESH